MAQEATEAEAEAKLLCSRLAESDGRVACKPLTPFFSRFLDDSPALIAFSSNSPRVRGRGDTLLFGSGSVFCRDSWLLSRGTFGQCSTLRLGCRWFQCLLGCHDTARRGALD
jgi:hypothetical protein